AELQDLLIGEVGEFAFPVTNAVNLQSAVSETPLRRRAEPGLGVIEPSRSEAIGAVGTILKGLDRGDAGKDDGVAQGNSLRWPGHAQQRCLAAPHKTARSCEPWLPC